MAVKTTYSPSTKTFYQGGDPLTNIRRVSVKWGRGCGSVYLFFLKNAVLGLGLGLGLVSTLA